MQLLNLLNLKSKQAKEKMLNDRNYATSMTKLKYFLFVIVCILLMISAITQKYGITFIVSESVDKKIIIYEKSTQISLKDLDKERLILFNLDKETKYTSKKIKLIKYPICKEGDILKVDHNRHYYCNNDFIGIARSIDSNNFPIDNFVFNGKIPKNKLFVLGTHEKSFDSRYFGFIDIKDIRGVEI